MLSSGFLKYSFAVSSFKKCSFPSIITGSNSGLIFVYVLYDAPKTPLPIASTCSVSSLNMCGFVLNIWLIVFVYFLHLSSFNIFFAFSSFFSISKSINTVLLSTSSISPSILALKSCISAFSGSTSTAKLGYWYIFSNFLFIFSINSINSMNMSMLSRNFPWYFSTFGSSSFTCLKSCINSSFVL